MESLPGGESISATWSLREAPPPPTSLFTIAQSDTMRIFVDVPQAASDQTTVGMPAEITAAQFPDRTFEGKITRTANSIDPASRTLRVEVDVPNPDLTLVPGCTLRFILSW